jgi:hypothetical protein
MLPRHNPHACASGCCHAALTYPQLPPVQAEALGYVLRQVEMMMHLEHPPTQLTPHQASTCRKAALLAIGDRINYATDWARCGPLLKTDRLWDFVSATTRHAMSGEQLQRLYHAMKGRQEKEREHDTAVEPGLREREQEEQARVIARVSELHRDALIERVHHDQKMMWAEEQAIQFPTYPGELLGVYPLGTDTMLLGATVSMYVDVASTLQH